MPGALLPSAPAANRAAAATAQHGPKQRCTALCVVRIVCKTSAVRAQCRRSSAYRGLEWLQEALRSLEEAEAAAEAEGEERARKMLARCGALLPSPRPRRQHLVLAAAPAVTAPCCRLPAV
jgi:hypothetical protein